MITGERWVDRGSCFHPFEGLVTGGCSIRYYLNYEFGLLQSMNLNGDRYSVIPGAVNAILIVIPTVQLKVNIHNLPLMLFIDCFRRRAFVRLSDGSVMEVE